MARHLPALAIALAVQLLIVAAVWWSRASDADAGATAFIEFDRTSIDRVTIDGDGATVILEKSADGWTLPALEALPADGQKVSDMLTKLEGTGASWPVATTDGAARRFEVTEEKYQRRIRLATGNEVAVDLYLGTSPGFRKVHARRADGDSVYAITFANYEAATKAEDWLDKSLIALDGDLTVVARPGAWRLSMEGESWHLDDLAEGAATDADKARDVVSKVTNLRVIGLAGEDQVSAVAESQPLFQLAATTGAEEVTYAFFRPDAEGDFLVRASLHPQLFRIAAYNAEGLDVARDSLIVTASPDEPADPEAEPSDSEPEPESTPADQ